MDHVRDLVATGGVSVVLAQDRDRFAREPAYHYLLRREFAEHGAKIRALNAAATNRYGSRERVPGRRWTNTIISGIVRQRVYSSTHEVRIDGDAIEREVPALVSPELQERARAALRENKWRPNREGNQRYLLGGLVRCKTCGYGCSGHTTWGKR